MTPDFADAEAERIIARVVQGIPNWSNGDLKQEIADTLRDTEARVWKQVAASPSKYWEGWNACRDAAAKIVDGRADGHNHWCNKFHHEDEHPHYLSIAKAIRQLRPEGGEAKE